MHPLMSILSAILLMITIDEFVSLMIGLWERPHEED